MRRHSKIPHKGFVLPLVVVISLIIMTGLGVWYRQVILQSFLSERVIQQRTAFIECRSLFPLLRAKMDQLTSEELQQHDESFLVVKDGTMIRWTIYRSAVFNGKVVFDFKPDHHYTKPIRLTMGYKTD